MLGMTPAQQWWYMRELKRKTSFLESDMERVDRLLQRPDIQRDTRNRLKLERDHIAIRLAKRMMHKQLSMTLDNALEDAALATLAANYTDDVKEGIAAFHENRKPNFKGS